MQRPVRVGARLEDVPGEDRGVEDGEGGSVRQDCHGQVLGPVPEVCFRDVGTVIQGVRPPPGGDVGGELVEGGDE